MQTLRYATKSIHAHTYWQVCHGHSTVVCVCVNSTDTRVPTVLAVDAVAIKRRILNWRFEGQTNTLSTHAHTQSHTHTHTWLRCNCAWKLSLSRTRIYARLQLWYKILAGLDQREKKSATNVNGRGRVRERDRLWLCGICAVTLYDTLATLKSSEHAWIFMLMCQELSTKVVNDGGQ